VVLADTSVWISHLHVGDALMDDLLESEEIVGHPLVIGELACGSIRDRSEVLSMLGELETPTIASHDEVLDFIERRQLWGVGLAYIDVHLLASALLSGIPLLTEDKHLRSAAEALGVSYGRHKGGTML